MVGYDEGPFGKHAIVDPHGLWRDFYVIFTWRDFLANE